MTRQRSNTARDPGWLKETPVIGSGMLYPLYYEQMGKTPKHEQVRWYCQDCQAIRVHSQVSSTEAACGCGRRVLVVNMSVIWSTDYDGNVLPPLHARLDRVRVGA